MVFQKTGVLPFFQWKYFTGLAVSFFEGIAKSLSLGFAEKNTQNYHLPPLTVKGLELYL